MSTVETKTGRYYKLCLFYGETFDNYRHIFLPTGEGEKPHWDSLDGPIITNEELDQEFLTREYQGKDPDRKLVITTTTARKHIAESIAAFTKVLNPKGTDDEEIPSSSSNTDVADPGTS